jgi:CheY-like chemotaxis protein
MKNRDASRPRILAVDDDPDFLRMLSLMLQPRYDVECLTGGTDLLMQLDVLRPDAVILDVHMPGVDGFSLCRAIRSDPRFAGLPVLFLTASQVDDDFIKNLRVGADAWLNKPVGRQALVNRLRELLAAPADAMSWVERS